MATDIATIISNLREFFDPCRKTVVSVGAGGGQFIGYYRYAKKVFAIDSDAVALQKLEEAMRRCGMANRFALIHSDFFDVDEKGDVVVFEFCLHEMSDPGKTVKHALDLAPRILVADHWKESPWGFFTGEEEKLEKSWTALEKVRMKKLARFEASQHFADYDELFHKVKGQGEESLTRIKTFEGKRNFCIPMPYAFALI